MTPLPAAVLFDMDGTLLDSEPLWLHAEMDTMQWLGGEWTSADQQACLGGPLERVANYMLDRADPHLRSSVDEVGRRLLHTVEELYRSDSITWRPGAADLLRDAARLGIPTALVTASWRLLIDAVHGAISSDLGLDPFTVTVAGDEVANSKPHPEPYLRAAELLSVSPASCLAIEDSPTGIASAMAAGCRVIGVPHIADVRPHTGLFIRKSLHGADIRELWAQTFVDQPEASSTNPTEVVGH